MSPEVRTFLKLRRTGCPVLVLASMLASCASPRAVSPPPGGQFIEPPKPIERRLSIVAYATHDGRNHGWMGTVEPAGSDSLLFVIPPEREHGLMNASPGQRMTLVRSDVKSVTGPSPVGTMLVFALFGVVAATLVIAGQFQNYWR